MTGMGMPMGQMMPPGPPSLGGDSGSLGAGLPLSPPPPAMPGGMQGGGVPGFPSSDPQSLAALIANVIAQAQSADQAQLHDMQDSAAQGAMMHPIVQGMMSAGQDQDSDPMRGVAGGALTGMPPAAPDASMLMPGLH